MGLWTRHGSACEYHGVALTRYFADRLLAHLAGPPAVGFFIGQGLKTEPAPGGGLTCASWLRGAGAEPVQL